MLVLGIPVIEIVTRPHDGAGAFSVVGEAPQHAADDEFASGGDDAFMLLTSGSTSRPKTVDSRERLSVSLQRWRHPGTWVSGPLAERAASLPRTWLDLGASGRAGCRLQCGLYARLRCKSVLWLADGVSTNLVHGGTGNPSSDIAGGGSAQRGRMAILPAARSLASTSLSHDVLGGLEALFGVPVIDTYGMTEAATQIAANPLQRRKPGSVGRPAGPEISNSGQ